MKKEGKMKKLLLATSILAGTAGLAAAEITFSGDARMGVKNDFVYDGSNDDTGFTSRARLGITFSGETDNGLTFGASFRADNSSNAANGTAGSVFLSGAFGKLSMGDVDGAAVAAVGHVDGVGLTGLDDLNESSFIANGGLADEDLTDLDSLQDSFALTGDPSALYEYSMNGFGLYLGVTNPGFESEIDVDGDALEDPVITEGQAWSIGANYAFEGYKVGFGYEDLQVDEIAGAQGFDADHLFLGADGTFGDFTAKVRYGQADVSLFDGAGGTATIDFEQFSMSGTYSMDAISVTAFYMDKEFEDITSRESVGLGASYDLGGGASVVGGIVDSEISDLTVGGGSDSDTAFDLGVSFSF